MDKVERTRKALKKTALTDKAVSESAGVNIWWLRKFKSGAIRDPSWRVLERLATSLEVE